MSTERPEFQPLDTPPARRTWPWAVVGAALVATLIWFVRRPPPVPEVRPAVVAAATPAPAAEVKPTPPPAVEAAKAALLPAKAPESPNVLGSTVATVKSMAMVAKAEFEREVQKSKSAQAQAASYKKQIDDLQKQLTAARAQIASMQTAQKPAPLSDQEQILQTLAPVLRAGNGGQP